MTIYEHIAHMDGRVKDADWDGLEHEFRSLAIRLAGQDEANLIHSLDFPDYEHRLRDPFQQALSKSRSSPVKAIYFEYDLDNSWHSAFYLCTSYDPQALENDDWPCDFQDVIPGPDFPAAGLAYRRHGFNKTQIASGITLYLVARTVAAFGRIVTAAPRRNKPICIAFHDQDPITRIWEPGGS